MYAPDKETRYRLLVGVAAAITTSGLGIFLWFGLAIWGVTRWPGWWIPRTILAERHKSVNSINFGYMVQAPRWSEHGYAVTVFAGNEGGSSDDEMRFRIRIPGVFKKIRTQHWLAEGNVVFIEVESKAIADSSSASPDALYDNVGLLYNYETGELRTCSTGVSLWYVASIRSKQYVSASCNDLEDSVQKEFRYTPPPRTRRQEARVIKP